MNLLPEFLIEKFYEYLDNPPLIVFLGGALLWGLIQILIDASVGNVYGIWVSLVFLALIFGSLAVFEHFMPDIALDWKEEFNWFNLLVYSMLGLTFVILSGILVSAFIPEINMWKVWKLSALTEEVKEVSPVVINFFGVAHTLGLDAKKLQDMLTNIFLVAPGEELTFRGVLTYSIGKPINSPWVGGVVSTGIWAYIHSIVAYTTPGLVLAQVLTAYVGGVIMLAMMVKTVDISTAIVIHAIYNALVVLFGGV